MTSRCRVRTPEWELRCVSNRSIIEYAADVRFRGKVDMKLRTARVRYDPKRTCFLYTPFRPVRLVRYDALFLKPRGSNEAARVHQFIW